LIASSHYTAQQIGAHLKVAPQNLSVVYLGKTVPVELMDRKTVSAPFLLTVGTLEPRKNLRATLEAYALLKRRMPGVPPLLVIGRQGWGDVNVRHWIAEHQLEQDVRLLGGVSDARLFDLYRTAAALVYPSLQEGFGFPPLEAMACGCPVITANVASLPEVVGEAALLIEPHQPEAIADAVQRVLTDAALADRLRRAGRARAELFSWERCARETLAVYRRVMAGAAAPEIAGA
jgi:glycosyltransferase involved in cell wall biosynthesis